MKSFRATGLTTIFVVALAGYTAWEYRRAGDEAGDTEHEKKLFHFQNEDVQEFQVTRAGKDSLLIRRVNGQWQMLKPVEDQVESTAMDAVLYSAQIQKGKPVQEEKDVKWAAFGLEPPGTVVDIKTTKGSETLAVSSKNAFDGSFYLRQGNELMLGEPGIAQAVLRENNTYRARKLWRKPETQVDHGDVEIAESKEHYSLHKADGKWAMSPAPSFPLDSARIDTWVTAVEGLTPTEIVTDAPSEDDKRSFLLLKPSLKITLNKNWILTVGQDKDEDIYVFTNQRPTVYKTQRRALAAIRVGREYFRESKHAFHFPLEQASEIRVNSITTKYTFKKENTNWSLKGGTPEQELNSEKLTALLQSLAGLEAQEFGAPPAAKLKGEPQVLILDGAGKTLFSLQWGDEYKSKSGYNQGQPLRPVKSNLEKDLMGITSSRLTALIDPGLVMVKAKPK